jgi:hypothetical protein
MRIFVNRQFRKFAVGNAVSDDSLCKAIREISSGLAHANLGGGVYKQRIARKGQGKSGGFRTIVFFRAHRTAFFILGFAKNEQDQSRAERNCGIEGSRWKDAQL